MILGPLAFRPFEGAEASFEEVRSLGRRLFEDFRLFEAVSPMRSRDERRQIVQESGRHSRGEVASERESSAVALKGSR